MSSNFPRVPGITLRASPVDLRSVTVEAVVDGAIAGEGQLLVQDREFEWRATFAFELAPGLTDPMVPSALIRWAEVETMTIIQREEAPLARSGRGRRSIPTLFCVDNPPEGEATAEAMAAAGLEFAVGEDEMTRTTANPPAAELPDGLTTRTWDESAAPLFFRAYTEAFRNRPGFPNWEESRWRQAFASDEAFRPDLSAVVIDGDEPAAFSILWVEDGVGWITQMGVRPEWRGKGLGEALLVRALQLFAAEGIETARLEVATNNPQARALYERLGFTTTSSYRSWRKTFK
ncbi:MAG: GNAT family N-acetyltransferase [Dehalococcoidia bacterium]